MFSWFHYIIVSTLEKIMNDKNIFEQFSLKKLSADISEKRYTIIYYLISISPLLYYFFKLPLTPARDWNYFNSLGLLIGEGVKNLRLPLLDPWVCGGLDILSNPQSWVYSPFVILNFLYDFDVSS